MKILIYGLNFAPEPTGTGKYTGEMAEWLVGRGHLVDVIAALPHYPQWEIHPEYKGKGFCRERIRDVNVYRVPIYVPSADSVTARNRIKLELSFSLNSLRWGIPLLFHSRYDVVIGICPPLQMGIYPRIYSILKKIPWVFHMQDLQVDAALRLGMLETGAFGRVLYGIEKNMLKSATRVSTITEAMRQRIIDKGIDEQLTWLFPNWSDIEFIYPLPHNNSFRQEIGVNSDRILLMYAGNMGEKQGIELILKAAEQLKTDSKLHFILVGNGAAKERLTILAQDKGLTNLTFLPVQPVERLPEMLAAADIHMVVQKREAGDIVMPSKLTNILAAGRPCIATADSGTTLCEVVTKYYTGLVGPAENLESFIANITILASSRELRSNMGANARTYAEQYLDKERILFDFESKLQSLVTRN